MKLLVKKKDGSVHIREKSQESGDNLDVVAPNKLETWAAFAKASHAATGGTMEDVIQSVIDEMQGVTFKADKQPLPVTEEDYQALLIQAANKDVSKTKLDALVVIVKKKDSGIDQLVKEILQKERLLTS